MANPFQALKLFDRSRDAALCSKHAVSRGSSWQPSHVFVMPALQAASLFGREGRGLPLS